MSYVTMDHAGWVERNAAAVRRVRKPTKTELHNAAIGRGWHGAPPRLSPWQRRAIDVLGIAFGGIYNAPIAWNAVDWRCGSGLGIPLKGGELSTFDGGRLTALVLGCHDARTRLSISPHGLRGLMLMLHPRSHFGGISARHPSIDEAVAQWRAYVPATHSLVDQRGVIEPCPACWERREGCGAECQRLAA